MPSTAPLDELGSPDAPLGALVSGVDLRKPLEPATRSLLSEGLRRHLVLLCRDQALGDREHTALAAQLGELLPHPIMALRGEGGRVTVVRDGGTRRPGNAAWHSDLSWLERPPGFAILRAVRIPASGGDTLWADMYAAWEALPERRRRSLGQLRAEHDFEGAVGQRLRRIDGSAGYLRVRRAFPPAIHPIARTHPKTGRVALFVNEAFTSRIVGVSARESDEILAELSVHVRDPRWQVGHRWREGDVVLWDERVTQHYASADHHPAEREVRRVTLVGERPM